MSEAFRNPDEAARCALLAAVRTIAVVGLSPDPWRTSHHVAQGMQRMGYRIIPVRPGGGDILGERVFEHLADLPEKPDLVNVFRRAEHLAGVVDECIALGLPRIWAQLGVVDQAAALRARAAGIEMIMDRCVYVDARGCGGRR